MFEVRKETVEGIQLIRIGNQQSGELVSIAPEFGGNVCELVLSKDGRTLSLLDGYVGTKEFVEHAGFKGVKLIPFPNRIRDGKYSFEGKSHQLDINQPEESHAIHGFFHSFQMAEDEQACTDESGAVTLTGQYSGEVHGYPFEFKVSVSYSLGTWEGFKCFTQIENSGDTSMPVGDGWHPYFSLGSKVDNMRLIIPADSLIEVDDRMIPTGVKTPREQESGLAPIGDRQFDDGFKLSEGDSVAITTLFSSEQDVLVALWQETGPRKYNYLQVYIPPDRNSIAIEPMTCNTNAFNNKEGLIILGPGEKYEAAYGVRLV